MQTKRIHYAFAGLSFIVAFLTYAFTMQPSIPFWDCGEFAAASSTLSIPHPPGAPLWTLVGRIALLLPTFSDPVARYNLFSVLSSALSVMLLYLIIVRLIRMWRGQPTSAADMITMYGGALVGALSYCFTDSFWFNALECEVYAFGSLFISLIPWLILVWYDHADKARGEKWLLLIFYVIGLSMGVHQLALLTVFPVFMLVYYKHWKADSKAIWGQSFRSWIIMAIAATIAFGIAFEIVLSDTVTWLGKGDAWALGAVALILLLPAGIWYTTTSAGKNVGLAHSIFMTLLVLSSVFALYLLVGAFDPSNKIGWSEPVLLIISLYAIYKSYQKNPQLLNLSLWASALLFLGFTTYASIMVRASQNPPMNQWHASTFDILHKYIDREQYGEARELPRRLESQKEDHQQTWDESVYPSSASFFWKYQTNHMYVRYWLWNFVGRASDNQDAGVDWSKTWGLPLFLGLFGLFWHFRRDPKRAFAILGMFVVLGVVTAWYQNQQDPQPRERDYFYVGAFYAYAIWVGIGATGILEMLRARWTKLKNVEEARALNPGQEVVDDAAETVPILRGQGSAAGIAVALLVLLVAVPLNQCIGLVGMGVYGQSFHQAAKWGEYSRYHNNVPLEYAYNILQSCDSNAILFTAGDNDTFPLWAMQDVYGVRRDIRIVNISLASMGWYIKQLKYEHPWGAQTIELPSFSREMLNADDDSPQGVNSVAHVSPAQMVTVSVNAATNAAFGGPNAPTTFSWTFTSQRKMDGGQYFYYPSDLVVHDIVQDNINTRPIYFALAVPPSYWNGLDNHIVYEGLAGRVVPSEHANRGDMVGGDINEAKYLATAYTLAPSLSKTPSRGMVLNSYRDPLANRSVLDDKYGTSTYFQLYGRLANYYLTRGNDPQAHRALDTLMVRLPANLVDYDNSILEYVGEMYGMMGDTANSRKYILLATKKGASDAQPSSGQDGLRQLVRRADLFEGAAMYDSARSVLNQLSALIPANDPNHKYIDFRLAKLGESELERHDARAALAKCDTILQQFAGLKQLGMGQVLDEIVSRRAHLQQLLGGGDSGGVTMKTASVTKK